MTGADVPRPIRFWTHCLFSDGMSKDLEKFGYMEPTGIQCQALPVALSGRDLIGIASTGSGKTAAFVLPMLVHIIGNGPVGRSWGPRGLIMAPTR